MKEMKTKIMLTAVLFLSLCVHLVAETSLDDYSIKDLRSFRNGGYETFKAVALAELKTNPEHAREYAKYSLTAMFGTDVLSMFKDALEINDPAWTLTTLLVHVANVNRIRIEPKFAAEYEKQSKDIYERRTTSKEAGDQLTIFYAAMTDENAKLAATSKEPQSSLVPEKQMTEQKEVSSAPQTKAQSAIAEFRNGQTKRFSTAGHPKAKGTSFSMKYPNSWTAKEGDRPNIIQKFQSDGGHGREIVLFLAKTFPLSSNFKPSDDDLKKLFAPANLKEIIESDQQGTIVLGSQITQIDGRPASMVDTLSKLESVGLTLHFRSIETVFFDGDKMVQVKFAVNDGIGSDTPELLEDRMTEFRPVFLLMANSIVVDGRWKQ